MIATALPISGKSRWSQTKIARSKTRGRDPFRQLASRGPGAVLSRRRADHGSVALRRYGTGPATRRYPVRKPRLRNGQWFGRSSKIIAKPQST
jgi:hypothetical protein